jgi:hypothetical protein
MSRPSPPDLAEDLLWQAILRARSEDEAPEEAAMVARAIALGGAVPGASVTADLDRRLTSALA